MELEHLVELMKELSEKYPCRLYCHRSEKDIPIEMLEKGACYFPFNQDKTYCMDPERGPARGPMPHASYCGLFTVEIGYKNTKGED